MCKGSIITLRVVFSTLFSMFRNVVKHGLLCLAYYFTNKNILNDDRLFLMVDCIFLIIMIIVNRGEWL